MDIKRRSLPGLLAALAFGLVSLPVCADVMYGTTRSGQLFTVDLTTGTGTPAATLVPCGVTTLGVVAQQVPGDGVTEIEYDSGSGKAFAQGSDGSFCGSTFNLATGSTISTVSTGGLSLEGMEVVDGTWYAAGYDGFDAHVLVTFDPSTGNVTPIGSTGLTTPLSGLAWDGSTMYAISGGSGPANLYTLNLTNGAATLVGSTGIQAGSLEFGPDGSLYAGGTGGGPVTTSSRARSLVAVVSTGNLYRINTSTGAATLVGPTGFAEGITGLMLAPIQEVPTLDPKALALLVVLLAVIGAVAIRAS
jgi:hypothetical protein